MRLKWNYFFSKRKLYTEQFRKENILRLCNAISEQKQQNKPYNFFLHISVKAMDHTKMSNASMGLLNNHVYRNINTLIRI